jgi:predicted transcriptional regulator of viral defense system
MATVTMERWVDGLQARGQYTFLRREAVHGSGLSPEAAKKALQRLARRGRVAKVKDYFYVVVPLEYREAGAPPVSWFVHDLMAAMAQPYYVGLLSAAGLHGASHQQPLEFQVVTDRSVRPVTIGRTRIRFFASKYVLTVATVKMKTPTGSMRVSTPEATVIDLMRFSKAAGHLDHVATLIAELAPSLDAKRLVTAVRVAGDVPNAQRLGCILDLLHAPRLTGPLHVWLAQHRPGLVLLRPGQPASGASENRRWRVLINRALEVEA